MPIRRADVEDILKEVKRFQKFCDEALYQDRLDRERNEKLNREDEYARKYGIEHKRFTGSALDGYGSAHTGQIRRASMDLTRALAKLRKSGI